MKKYVICIASSKDEAEQMVQDHLQSEEWRKGEAEAQEMGVVSQQYLFTMIREGDAGDAPDNPPAHPFAVLLEALLEALHGDH